MRLHPPPAAATGVVPPPPGRLDGLAVLEIVSGFPKLSETFIVDQIAGLTERGAQVDLWSFEDPGEPTVAREVVESRLLGRTRYLELPTDSRSVEEWLLRFHDANRITPSDVERYDVVHVNFGPVFVGLEPLLAFADVPVVVSFYGYDLASFVAAHRPGVYEHLFRRVALATAVSESGRRRLVELGCPPDRAVVQRAGIRLDDRWHAPSPAGTDGGPLEVLTVARLVDKKGVDDAIRAIAATRSEAQLRIIGDGPLRPQLEVLVDQLDLAGRVRFEGARSRQEVEAAIRSADVVLQMSRTATDGDQEGIPVVLVMAAAAGRAIVATDHSGIPELVRHGVGGLLVAERDHLAAAAVLDELHADPTRRDVLGRGARLRCEEEFDQRRLDDLLVTRLTEVAASHRAGGIERRAIAPLRRIALHGRAQRPGECPVCDSSVTFRIDDDGGVVPCPECGSTAATRTLVRFLIDRTDRLDSPSRVLTIDAPPGLSCELDAVIGGRHRSATRSSLGTLRGERFSLVIPCPDDELGHGVLAAGFELLEPGGWLVGPVSVDAADHRAVIDRIHRLGGGAMVHDPVELWDRDVRRASGVDDSLRIVGAVRPRTAVTSGGGEVDVGAVIVTGGRDGDAVIATAESVLAQRRSVAELVVVAGPSLGTSVVDALGERGRLDVVVVDESDPTAQRRIGLAHVRAAVAVCLDAGDTLTARAVDAVCDAARESPDAGLITGDALVVDATGAVIDRTLLVEPYHGAAAPEHLPVTFVRRGVGPDVVRHAGATLITSVATERPKRDHEMAGFVLHAIRKGEPGDVTVWDDLRPGLAALHAFGGGHPTVLAWRGATEPDRLPASVRAVRVPDGLTADEARTHGAGALPDGMVVLVDDRVVIGPDSLDLLLADVAAIESAGESWRSLSARCDSSPGAQRGPLAADAVASVEPVAAAEVTLTVLSSDVDRRAGDGRDFVSRSHVHRPAAASRVAGSAAQWLADVDA